MLLFTSAGDGLHLRNGDSRSEDVNLHLSLHVLAKIRITVADHVATWIVLAHDHVALEGVLAAAIDRPAADGGGPLPDQLGEMAGLFGEAGGVAEVVHVSFVAPGVDGGGHVWVADGEVFAGGAARVRPLAIRGPGGGGVGEGGVPCQGGGVVLGSEVVGAVECGVDEGGFCYVRC